jgi:hypothetical protein
MPPSRMGRLLAFVRTDVSKERIASTISVKISLLRALAVTTNWSLLRKNWSYNSHAAMTPFIVTAVKTSNLTSRWRDSGIRLFQSYQVQNRSEEIHAVPVVIAFAWFLKLFWGFSCTGHWGWPPVWILICSATKLTLFVLTGRYTCCRIYIYEKTATLLMLI